MCSIKGDNAGRELRQLSRRALQLMAYRFVPVMDQFRFALELKDSKETERRTCPAGSTLGIVMKGGLFNP